MSDDIRPVVVHILEKEYRIACGEDERDGLVAAAQYLNGKMKEIRDTGRVVGADRIAVMAALNIAHEFLGASAHKEHYKSSISSRIRALQDKIEHALAEGRQLEL